MMKYFILVVCSLFVIVGKPQKYGNEWIDLSQQYFKIKVLENGFHKVSYQELTAVGVPLTDVNPQELQLWYRGNQLAIEVKGENDGVFNETDALVFYGNSSNGALETPLYYKPEYQQQTSYSLYSDTSYYYLTWKEGEKGKRIQEQNTTNVSKVKTVKATQEIVYSDDYSLGSQVVEDIFKAEMDNGEGWMSGAFGYQKNKPTTNFKEIEFTGLNNVPSSTNLTLEVGIVGRNGLLHRVEVQAGNSLYKVPDFSGYTNAEVKMILSSNDIIAGSLKVKIACLGDDKQSNDYVSISFIRLSYNTNLQTSGLEKERYRINTSGLLTLKNTIGLSAYAKTSESMITKLKSEIQGDSLQISLPVSQLENELLFFKNEYKTIHSIKKIKGFVDDLIGSNYIILYQERFKEGATQYKAYRESAQGGEYKVHLVDLERVFDQYMFGEKNPLAVRDLFRYLIDNNQKPAFFLIIGSGLKHNIKYYGVPFSRKLPFGAKNNKGAYYYPQLDYVLTFGDPGWDIGFTAGLAGEDELSPAVPTSRIPSVTNQDVINYLNKVKEFENPTNNGLWRKRFIHISGGQFTGQQQQFQNFAKSYTDVVEKPLLGAKVATFTKKSDAAVQFFNVSKEVNAGVGMIAYIGHSSPLFLEIDIGMATDEANGYRNKGKYPLLYFNGCYSGDIFQQYSKAQDWVLAAEKGAIGAFAHNAYGYTNQLHDYTLTYYLEAYANENNLNEPIGLVHKRVIKSYLSGKSRNEIVRSQAQLLSLIGDPAVRVFPYTEPDYLIEKVKVTSFDAERVTAVSDSFMLNVVVSNLGVAKNQPFNVCVERVVNQGQTTIEYGPFIFNSLYYQDTLQIPINTNSLDWAGLNQFIVKINCNDSLPEHDKTNNNYSFSYILPSNGVRTLFPKEFSILPDSLVKFQAQTFNLAADSAIYQYQLDTSVYFKTPMIALEIKAKATIETSLIDLPITKDTTVYYWRIKQKADSIWERSSFTYIPFQKGVGQFQLNQFYKNKLEQVFRDTLLNKWQFDTSKVHIDLKSTASGMVSYGNKAYLKVNQTTLMNRTGEANCGGDNLFFLAFDKQTALPFHPDGITAGNCGLDPKVIFNLNRLDIISRQNLAIEYINKVKENEYLLMYTVGNPRLGTIGDSLRTILKGLGAELIDSLQNGLPYVFLCRVGNGEIIFEQLGKTISDSVVLQIDLGGTITQGAVWSPLIGPASKWNSFEDNFYLENKDAVSVDLWGVRFDFTDSLLYSLPSATSHYLSLDSLNIDETEFPYLKTKTTFVDSVDFSSPQLNYWSVNYTGVPEGTLVLTDEQEDDVEELFEGTSYHHTFLFANISDANFSDSLTVEFQLIGERETQIWTQKIVPVLAGDTVAFSVNFTTQGWSGTNQLQVFVNPYVLIEQDYTNNVFELNLSVLQDLEQPLLDVLINNTHIRDGDWVKNNPLVEIFIFDNNEFKPLSDTLGTLIYFKTCDTCDFSRLYFEDERLTWAIVGDTLKIDFSPGYLNNGFYSIRVISQDNAGNKVSETPFELGFEIRNEKSITIQGPYPNPIMDEVHFKFAFSGDAPADLRLEIYDLKGGLVRLFTAKDYSLFRVGKIGGWLKWDMTNENDNRLPQGFYFYLFKGATEYDWVGERSGKLMLVK